MSGREFCLLFNAARDLARSRFIVERSRRDYAVWLARRLRDSAPAFAFVDERVVVQKLVRAIASPLPPAPEQLLLDLAQPRPRTGRANGPLRLTR